MTFKNPLLRAALPCLATTLLQAQNPGLTLPFSGNNQRSTVSQTIGPVKVAIEYSSPAVHGPDGSGRRGKIWGKLVPYGLANLGFGNGKPGPWRAGANENTVFETSHTVLIQGKPLPAGRYGVHLIPAENQDWTLIFSKNSTSWGSFFYEESEDALRVPVTPAKHEYREWLTYEFTKRLPAEAVVELQWEDLALPWTIKVQSPEEIYISKFKAELRNNTGFTYQAYLAAVQYCLANNTHLEDALLWSEAAIGMTFVGQANFQTLTTKAQVLQKMGREEESKKALMVALNDSTATPMLIHGYARQLQMAKDQKGAFEIFRFNAKKNGEVWPVAVGLARVYSAEGDYPKALVYAKKALEQAPDDLNKKSLAGMIELLSKGKPVAQ